MNAYLIRILTLAYQLTEDESIKGKIARLIRDEVSRDFQFGKATAQSLDRYPKSSKKSKRKVKARTPTDPRLRREVHSDMKIQSAYYTGTHPYSFRSGESGVILGIKIVSPAGATSTSPNRPSRPCFHVCYPDGVEDYSPISETEHYQITGTPV